MAAHGQPMRAGQPRRPGTDHGHAPARGRRPRKWLRGLHRHIGRMALQPADLDRLALSRFAHAGAFAKCLGRADTGAHAAKDIRAQDRFSRRLGRAGGDLADEQRDVDAGWTGLHTGGVMAEIAAIRGHGGLVRVERRGVIGKSRRDRLGRQSGGGESGGKGRVCHGWLPICGGCDQDGTGFDFYQTVKL